MATAMNASMPSGPLPAWEPAIVGATCDSGAPKMMLAARATNWCRSRRAQRGRGRVLRQTLPPSTEEWATVVEQDGTGEMNGL